MTGLDVEKDTVIEIACFITDGEFNLADYEGFESVIHKPNEVMDNMNQWCIEHHGTSGLTDRVLKASPEEKSLKNVEDQLFNYIQHYVPQSNLAVLGGNSVHMDKFFMTREFPKVVDHLHHRVIDVSSFSEVMKRINPRLYRKQPRKNEEHTAKSDILESIDQMRWIARNFLRRN